MAMDFARLLRDEKGQQILAHLDADEDGVDCLSIRFLIGSAYACIQITVPENVTNAEEMKAWFDGFSDAEILKQVKGMCTISPASGKATR